jgi:DnaJ-class molecular chaperone
MAQIFNGNRTERQGAVLPKAGFSAENHPDEGLAINKLHHNQHFARVANYVDSSHNLDASTTCDACYGSGRHAHGFRGGVCSICAGRGWL